MQRERKTAFKMPYAGIDAYNGIQLLYGEKGGFSVIMHIDNPVLQYSADPEAYIAYQSVLLNIIKILGEGHIIQKQDVFIRKKYKPIPANEFLQQKYHTHFEGREYTDIKTYLIITRQVKRGAFYTFDKKVLADFFQNIGKVSDLLAGAGFDPKYLTEAEINRYVSKVLSMEFASPTIALNNMRCNDSQLNLGDAVIRCLSIVNTDAVELPEKVGAYTEKQDNKGMRDFPVDNLSFLHQVPGYKVIIYNQLLEIPSQQMTLNKLELKRKRHLGVPDPANLMCVEDIDMLLVDVARENQLLVNAHYSLIVCANQEHIDRATNFIEAALFQQGIIPSRNAYNQLELFRCALPGNGVELQKYDWFLTTADAALCLFFKEALVKDEPSDFLIRFTDRQGVPVAIDLSDLPMRTGRISARNRFCLGPSGAGKSYLINALVEQYMLYNMDVVIVDTGHSYSGLCSYYHGKYITWSENKPITMNPFAIAESEYNIEKKDFLCTLISLLWKGSEGTVSTVERDVISNVISGYYSQYFDPDLNEKNKVAQLNFNSFYEFALERIPEIKREEKIPFELDEFRYVLKKFYLGGEFDTILNEASDKSLFSERFIVYEIDNLKENKILFPIVTLAIMDVFIQKMRHRSSQRKALIIEEAWKAIASPLMAGYILYLYKTVRKFWGEAIVVTQELGDIIGNAVVKDSIISNSDTIFLLDQSKFKENYKEIAKLLSITETEQKKIFTINNLDNKEGRARFKEVYIRRGATGEVYGVENSIYQYLTYTTEKPEKNAVEVYVKAKGSYQDGLETFVSDLERSGLTLEAFVHQVNNTGLPVNSFVEYFKPDFI
ncbi:Bacteroides conjugation system ATPase, TraG family [Pedobacter terrae]|uniref:Bacteroides conjugation system ATPase, TraG family n=1 Tax=Pedobacter terrae TaxID=405671 RepID=A0A1G7Q819_9SPHI|nr:TraG family conjugative transposon ATPase [Pedobacter terrae]SDF94671.1 Bacteroides conjugation system ATPase, TraG family [Pedobacter terrae]